MSASSWVSIYCDAHDCPARYDADRSRIGEARAQARAYGWRTGVSVLMTPPRDYCPKHADTGSGGQGGVEAFTVAADGDLRRRPSDHCDLGTSHGHGPHAYWVDDETTEACPGWTEPDDAADTGSGGSESGGAS